MSSSALDGAAGPGDRVDRLHEDVRGPDPAVRAGRYRVLGTDGFGRSDYRRKLRAFFEVDRHYVALAALKALAEEGKVKPCVVARRDQQIRHQPGEAEPR